MQQRPAARLASLTGVLALVLLVAYAHPSADANQADGSPQLDLKRYEGFTEPSRELVVESYVDGVLETLHAQAGDRFAKDDLLVSLDDSVQVLAVEVARLQSVSQGQIKIAKARVTEAEVELESQRDLAKNGSATPRDVRRAQAALDVARAELELSQENATLAAKQLEIEQQRLTRYTIRAPFDGQVLAIAKQDGAEEGAALQQNDRIMHIAQLDPIVAKISLPETVVSQLSVGQAYPLQVGGGESIAHGSLSRIAAQADRGSQLIEVVFEIKNPDSVLRSGLRCQLLGIEPADEFATQ